MDRIRILQIGTENWSKLYDIPENVRIIFPEGKLEKKKEIYEIVVLERNLTEEEVTLVRAMSMTYCFFAVDSFNMDRVTAKLFKQRMGKILKKDVIQPFLDREAKKFFPKPYGEKFKPENVGVAQGFKGSVRWNGQYSVSLDGEYGAQFNQIAFWRTNIPLEMGQAVDIWLEYKKSEGVELELSVKQFVSGSLADVLDSWVFSEEDLMNPVIIEGRKGSGPVYFSLRARGTGRLDIIALHDRISRWNLGTFMVGGERHVTSEREEIFSYFDPGDMKPPLAVYFSGYKTQEGFEGLYMMRKMGCPFLLITEQRFEGGGFYMGSPEYEQM
ncbi:MAG: accessory Sec system protein Asp2, partial [Pseudobutyrivibrio sp.]|nr:accessory Sec system protein Asp2 [Pseudobutyrivibrio sp.]